MTRSTRVAVTSPGIDPMDMWRVMATLVRAPEQYRFEVTSLGIHAHLGQGLCALLDLTHAVGGAQIPRDPCDEDCGDPCESGWAHDPAHYLMADFDTAYIFTASCGCRSGGLHLQLVHELGHWLDQQGATWEWYDESGDGWHHGPDWGSLGCLLSVCAIHRGIPAPAASRAAVA